VKNHIGKVLRALAVVGYEELVCRINGEVHWQLGDGGRHRSDIIDLPLNLLGAGLPRWGLELGWHVGVVVVVVSSVVGSGIGVVSGSGVGVVGGSVVLITLFTVNFFV
jgi:hypothetical protein